MMTKDVVCKRERERDALLGTKAALMKQSKRQKRCVIIAPAN